MSNRGKKTAADDDVEQLLRAAQDDALLKLSINSHIARATSSIDPDLDRRLQALKKPQNGAKIDDSVKTKPKKLETVAKVDGAVGKDDDDDDDLFARFAALKSTLPCYGKIGNESEGLVDDSVNREVGDEESEDEVEKVIKWAIDAARLDPSPPTDDDSEEDEDEDDDDDDDEIVDSRKKSKKK